MKDTRPLSERPLPKLQYFGAGALSNAELISLILGTGTRDKTAVQLADDVLEYFSGDLKNFGTMYASELTELSGVGEAKAASVAAAVELGKRISSAKKALDLHKFHDSRDVAEFLMEELRYESQERFLAFYLDAKCRLIGRKTISIGTINSAPVHPREVFEPAVKTKACAVIVAHNHPSGDPTPSPQDIALTKRLVEAGEIIGIKVLDHVIVGNGCFDSMKADGYMDEGSYIG